MSEQKIYVGGAKENNGQYGTFHRVSFSKQDLEVMTQNLNEKGYVNLNMNKRREPSQFGQTHSLVIDTWQPDPSRQQAQQPSNPRQFEQPPQSQAQQDAQQQAPSFTSNDIDNDPDDCPF